MRLAGAVDTVSRPFMTIDIDVVSPVPAPPVLMAANHRSLVDVFVALICCRRLGRPTRFIVGRSFFAKPGLGIVLRRIGCIEGGRRSGATAVAVEAIGSGASVAIMPEGAITTMEPGHVLAPLLPGVAEIWARTGCPLVTVGITGAGEVWRDGHRLPRRPHLRGWTRPVIHVRVVAEAVGDDPPTLERIFALMEANCRQSERDRRVLASATA
jgi:1-acyl-sn-glycerol-3-phosphate acyltransferase